MHVDEKALQGSRNLFFTVIVRVPNVVFNPWAAKAEKWPSMNGYILASRDQALGDTVMLLNSSGDSLYIAQLYVV